MGEKKVVLRDLSPVFGKRRYPPVACYLFGNVVIVDPQDKVFFLCLTEDRKDKNIWTLFGGEIEYLNVEQFPEGAAREMSEESGVPINPEDLILLDSKISYPTPQNDPYGGVILVINSYLYILKPEDPIPSMETQIPEEGCNIIEIRKFSLSKLWESVKDGEINLFPNFIETLKKLEEWLNKNLGR